MFCIRIFFLIGLFFSFFAQGQSCEEAFIKGSRLYYEIKQNQIREESRKLHPTNTDPKIDRYRQDHNWNEKPNTPELLKVALPKDVHFLKYQQFEPSAPTAVKFDQQGSAVIARAHYSYQGTRFSTNVVFNRRALTDNMNSEKNWLVGENAKAAILFLHGGGTRTTGAHVARTTVTHFDNLHVDVVAIDMPWHNQGHRNYLSFESEIRVLSNFVKKFIPPHVPLFVWGHSYGSVFAEQLRMMTDRPHDDFLFHNNLRGVLIMSTAVDTAPGRPAQEKLEILEQVIDDVQANRLQEGAPAEQQVLSNLVEDGKVSPLGGFAATANMIQFDQTLPEHKGKYWVPGVMVVGKYDTLVYIGNEARYEIYKTQENLETHYLDRLTHIHNNQGGPIDPVGHLLRDMLDPKSRTPIDLLITKNFIEEQLQVRAVKKDIVNVLRRSNQDSAINDHITQELKYLHFFKQIEQFFSEDPVVVQHLDPATLTTIQQIIRKEKKPPILVKVDRNKDRVSSYIQVVQNFANDLAFRDFLIDYRFGKDKKTANVKTLIVERDQNVREVTEILYPYSTPQRRTFHILNQLSFYRPNDINAKALLDEIKAQMMVIMEPSFLARLNNNNLKADLLALSRLLSVENIESVKKRAQEIKERYENIWPKQNVQSNNIGALSTVTRLFFSDSVTQEQAISELKLENLPEKLMNRLSVLTEKHFKINSILNQLYVPKMEDLQLAGIIPGREKRVENAIDDLQDHIQSAKEFFNLFLASVSKEKGLKKRYKELIGKVLKDIKTIRKALEKASFEPPYSLKTEYQKSRENLEKLKVMFREMEKGLNEISATVFDKPDQLAKEADIDNVLQVQREVIESFSDTFFQYIHNRSLLRKKVISAIENGEMGEDVKSAVINIYGPFSNGERPKIGTKSLYLELETVMLDLAKVEAEKIKYHRLLMEVKMEYNITLSSILQMLEQSAGAEGKSRQVIVDLERASNIINIIDISMFDVLNKSVVVNDQPTPVQELRGSARDKAFHYIKSEEKVFDGAVLQWNGMSSSLSPILPTE